MKELSDRILRRSRELLYLRQVRGILDTAPIIPRDDGVVLFSMIGTRVLLPYLVAVKSLHHFLQRGRVVILDDGTLTQEDKEVLRHHCGNPEIRLFSDVDTKGCPTYTSWRRLFTLLDLRRENYVIQLDSDTVTIGDVPLVRSQIENGRDFILMGEPGVEFSAPGDVAAQARAHPEYQREHVHVQLAMEAQMDKVRIPGRDTLSYARGCAGFAGFAPDASGSQLAEAFSAEASRLLGFDHWKQWGSEQVTSNFLVSNEPGSVLLPYEHYCNFWNEPYGDDMRFVHFIGTFRFHGGLYGRLSRIMADKLRAAETALRCDAA